MLNWLKKRLKTVNPACTMAITSLMVLAGLVLLLSSSALRSSAPDGNARELTVYCAAGMRIPAAQVAKDYESEFGLKILYVYGGSNTLLSQLELSKQGDLYLAADESYLEIAQQKNLLEEVFPLAQMNAVIIVPEGNPAQVLTIDDLLRKDVRVAIANPDQAAMGKVTRACLKKTGDWKTLETRVRENGVFKPTVSDVANDVLLGSVDAGIVWDAVAQQIINRNPSSLKIIRVPEFDTGKANICVGVLTASKNPKSALHFARYLAARDRGLKVFKNQGYKPVNGDSWADHVQLTFFSGSVNRRALEPIIKKFEQRHGIKILTVYNGCGILTAQMRSLDKNANSGSPDAFMACDIHYMNVVNDLFQETAKISDVPIVLVVQPGNPKGIRKLEDLTKPGLRLALGQPEQCTIGVLSRKLLEDADIYQQVMNDSVVAQTATSALLIPSVITGAVDAALVYRSDALAEGDKVDIVMLDSPLAQAIQPYGIARSSDQKHLVRLLYQAISQSRKSFESAGFRWRLNKKINRE